MMNRKSVLIALVLLVTGVSPTLYADTVVVGGGGVDGQDIAPASVTTTGNLTVGGDLTVSGAGINSIRGQTNIYNTAALTTSIRLNDGGIAGTLGFYHGTTRKSYISAPSNGNLGLFSAAASDSGVIVRGIAARTGINAPAFITDGSFSTASGTNTGISADMTLIQTGTAGYNGVASAITKTTTGSGDINHFVGITDTVEVFRVDEAGLQGLSATAGLTADAGSIQGGLPLTANVNEISTVGTTGDSATLKPAVAGLSFQQTIINNGANAMDVFPASGDNLGAGADTAASLAAAARITYTSYDATNWIVL